MRTAVVTGASGGIGSAIARRLASDGFAVVVGYHSAADRAAALVADLDGSGHSSRRISVLEHESRTELAATLAAEPGSVDVLVNCAGITVPVAHDDLDTLDDRLVTEIFATNWLGPFAVIRALRKLLDAAPQGAVVVNISSVAAVTGQGSNVAYCASKAALDSMTRSLGRALAPSIRVVSVSPGYVPGDYAARMPAGVLEEQTAQTPLGRLAAPADVAAAVSAVVSDLGCTTGAVIPVDGGRPLGIS